MVCCFIVSPVFAQSTPGEFRSKETHGFGFGIEGSGYSAFYDHALNDVYQIHLFLSGNRYSSKSMFGNNFSSTTSKLLTGSSIRIFPNESFGYFFGFGVGFAWASQSVNQNVYCYEEPLTYDNPSECAGREGSEIHPQTNSSYSAISIWGTVGWQGYAGYYFTVGYLAGVDYVLSQENNTDHVIDRSNYKSTARKDWEYATSGPTSLVIGFGWHL